MKHLVLFILIQTALLGILVSTIYFESVGASIAVITAMVLETGQLKS